MQYVVTIRQHGTWKADLSVPSAKDAGTVCQTLLSEFPDGLAVDVYPCPQLPEGMALPIDHPHGALASARVQLDARVAHDV